MSKHRLGAIRSPRGIARLLDDLRIAQYESAESEFAEMCTRCGYYPAVLDAQCFNCQTSGKVLA